MSGAAVDALLGVLASGVVLLALAIARIRERLVRLEQRVADKLNGS